MVPPGRDHIVSDQKAGSPTASSPGCPDRAIARTASSRASVRDDAPNVASGQQLPAAQVGQLDQELRAYHLPAQLLDQLDDRLGGAAGGDHVVDHEHTLARAY